MPIAAENRAKYPPDWKAIRARILERAKKRCEWCGVKNYAVLSNGKPTAGNREHDAAGQGELSYREAREFADAGNQFWPEENYKVVVLTVAHLDHGLSDHSDGNLAALCQKCHLTHDAKQHAANAKITRDRKRGQGRLFE